MKNPFIKYVVKEKKEDIFHSSAYGKAQNGGIIGVASAQSFSERMKIEKNRRIVQAYNDSRVAEQRFNGGVRAKQYVAPEKKESFGAKPIDNGKQAGQGRTTAPTPYKNRFGK